MSKLITSQYSVNSAGLPDLKTTMYTDGKVKVGLPEPVSNVRASDAPGKPNKAMRLNIISKTMAMREEVAKMGPAKNLEINLPEPAGEDGKWAFRKTLNVEQKTEVLKALAKHDNDWGKLVKAYANGTEAEKQLLADTRTFQIELTNELRVASGMNAKQMMACGSVGLTSDNDFTCLAGEGQDVHVAFMATAFKEIFGKEAGVVFDTNFYSAHIALESGFDITSQEVNEEGKTQKDLWLQQNDVQSKVKQAEHYANSEEGHGDNHKTKFEGTRFYEKLALPTAENAKAKVLAETGDKTKAEAAFKKELSNFKYAFNIANNVKIKVNQTIEEIKNEKKEAMKKLASEEKTESLEYKDLESALDDPKSIEMEAKNKIYSSILVRVEEGKMRYDEKSTQIYDEIQKLPPEKQEKVVAWVNMGCPKKTEESYPDIDAETALRISELNYQKQEIGVQTMALQSEGLHYASEPYYAQATIVSVVAAIQMAGGEAVKIITNPLTGLPKDIQNTLIASNLDLAQMTKDFLLMGKISDDSKVIFEKLDTTIQNQVNEKLKSAKAKTMEKLKKDYPVLHLDETSKFSLQENHGDFVKDYAHYMVHGDPASEDKFMLKGSKYLFRTALCGVMNLEQKTKKDDNLLKAFESLRDESKKMLDVRQKSTGDVKKDIQTVRDSATRFLNEVQTLYPDMKDKIDMNKLGESMMNVVEAMMAKV